MQRDLEGEEKPENSVGEADAEQKCLCLMSFLHKRLDVPGFEEERG